MILYDQFLERFEKLNKIVQLINEKINGRCYIETKRATNTDAVIRIDFWYKPGYGHKDNAIIAITDVEEGFKCWCNCIKSINKSDIINQFMNRDVDIDDICDTKIIVFNKFKVDENKIDTIANSINDLIDLYEAGTKIREKTQKQLEIVADKFFFTKED